MNGPDVRAIVHTALSSVQGTTHHLGLVTLDVLADRVTEAVTPLVTADEQVYPGELAMFRTLVRTLRVAARQGDLPAVRQALVNHAVDDANAREGAGFTVLCGSCTTNAPLAVAAKEWQTTSGQTWQCPACAGGRNG